MSIFTKITDYLLSAKNELSKVTWPSRQVTIRYSALVIAISVGVAAFFGFLDVGLSQVVTTALANKKVEQTQPADQAPVVPVTTQPAAQDTTQPQTIQFDNVTPITTPTDNKAPATDNTKK